MDPDLLSRTPPPRDVPLHRLEARRTAMLEAIAPQEVPSAAKVVVLSPRRHPRSYVILRYVAAAAVVALIAFSVIRPGERFGPTQAAADTLATVVSNGSTASIGAGQFSYIERIDYSANSDHQGILSAQTSTVDEWLRTDGSGFRVTDRSEPTFF